MCPMQGCSILRDRASESRLEDTQNVLRTGGWGRSLRKARAIYLVGLLQIDVAIFCTDVNEINLLSHLIGMSYDFYFAYPLPSLTLCFSPVLAVFAFQRAIAGRV